MHNDTFFLSSYETHKHSEWYQINKERRRNTNQERELSFKWEKKVKKIVISCFVLVLQESFIKYFRQLFRWFLDMLRLENSFRQIFNRLDFWKCGQIQTQTCDAIDAKRHFRWRFSVKCRNSTDCCVVRKKLLKVFP